MWVFFYYLARFWFQPLCFMQQLVNKRQIRRYSTMWHRTLVRHWLALRLGYPHISPVSVMQSHPHISPVSVMQSHWIQTFDISVTNPSLPGILIFVSRKTPRPTKLSKDSIHILFYMSNFMWKWDISCEHAGESAHFICEIQIFRCESKSSYIKFNFTCEIKFLLCMNLEQFTCEKTFHILKCLICNEIMCNVFLLHWKGT